MNAVVRSFFRCFRRVLEFLAAHNFADAPAGLGKQLDELKVVVDEMSQGGLDQEAGFRLTKAQTKHQHELRAALTEQHMRPISRVARDVFGIEGMEKALKMPRPAVPTEALVASAGAMAEAAERHQAAFVEHGLAPDFVASLRGVASELANAVQTRDGTQRRRVEATRRAKELTKRGRRAVRLLNAILRPKLADDPSLLAAWDNVRRVKDTGGGVSAVSAAEPAVPSAATQNTAVPSPTAEAPATRAA